MTLSAIYQQARTQLYHLDPRGLQNFVSATDLKEGLWNSLLCTAVFAASRGTSYLVATTLDNVLPYGSGKNSRVRAGRTLTIVLSSCAAGLAVSCVVASRLPPLVAFTAEKAIRTWIAINLPIYLLKCALGKKSKLLCTISLKYGFKFNFAIDALASLGAVAGCFKDSSPIISGVLGALPFVERG